MRTRLAWSATAKLAMDRLSSDQIPGGIEVWRVPGHLDAGAVAWWPSGHQAGWPAVPVLAGQHRLKQPGGGRSQRGAHRLLQHAEGGEPLLLGDLPLGLLQLRPVPPVTRLCTGAVRLAALATPHLSASRVRSPTWEIRLNSSARRRFSHARSRPEKSDTSVL